MNLQRKTRSVLEAAAVGTRKLAEKDGFARTNFAKPIKLSKPWPIEHRYAAAIKSDG